MKYFSVGSLHLNETVWPPPLSFIICGLEWYDESSTQEERIEDLYSVVLDGKYFFIEEGKLEEVFGGCLDSDNRFRIVRSSDNFTQNIVVIEGNFRPPNEDNLDRIQFFT